MYLNSSKIARTVCLYTQWGANVVLPTLYIDKFHTCQHSGRSGVSLPPHEMAADLNVSDLEQVSVPLGKNINSDN